MAARLNKRHSDMVRLKIKSSQLINALKDHALGKNDMSATQVRAAEILLNKSVPNLSSVEMQATVKNVTDPAELSDAELANIAATSSTGDSQPQDGAFETAPVH